MNKGLNVISSEIITAQFLILFYMCTVYYAILYSENSIHFYNNRVFTVITWNVKNTVPKQIIKNKLQTNSIVLQKPFWEWQVYQKNSFQLLSSLPFSYGLFVMSWHLMFFYSTNLQIMSTYLPCSKSTFTQWQLHCSHYNDNCSIVSSYCITKQRMNLYYYRASQNSSSPFKLKNM